MSLEQLKNLITQNDKYDSNNLMGIRLSDSDEIFVYPKSINIVEDSLLLIGRHHKKKYLIIIGNDPLAEKFDGESIGSSEIEEKIKLCPLNHKNALLVQSYFPFTKPVRIGLNNSFGFGDRLGLANPAHIRSLQDSDFKPIIAQQSIRELTRTQRKAEEVMDAAVWAVFQEGYKNGFGSDADHLKSTDDIDLIVRAGFTMFTFDPGEHVINEADELSLNGLKEKIKSLNWQMLDDSFQSLELRYKNKKFEIGDDFSISPSDDEIIRAAVKYLNAVAHIRLLYTYLSENYSSYPFEVEISVDETESVTTPFEHFFMASELTRLDIKFVSLAPRFIGDFEKGIDYKGDIEVFKAEYIKHAKISEHFGTYKISLHSGSDKFIVYKAIGQINRGVTHVKTAGTSYLEALKVIAAVRTDDFRNILDFSRLEFEKEKKSYHVSAELSNVNPASEYSDEELVDLFQQDDARQILHVTFGRVLTAKNENGQYLFRDTIFQTLENNENLHYQYLIKHFRNHLEPFRKS
jgi:hypothetical protein